MEGTGPTRPSHPATDTPDPGRRCPASLGSAEGSASGCGVSRVARPAPALTQHSCPTVGRSVPRGPVPGSAAPAPRSSGPSGRVRPTHRARSPPRHRQRAPAASQRLRTLPASQALARGHVTDGRRSRVRVRTPRSPARALGTRPPSVPRGREAAGGA